MCTRVFRQFAPRLSAARCGMVAAMAMMSSTLAAGPAAAWQGTAPVSKTKQLQQATADLKAMADSLRGAVVAFNASMCPAGWEPYAPAQGRFIRGINQNGDRSIDPDGVRAPGSVQADELKSHTHTHIQMVYDNNVDGVDSTVTHSGEHHNEQRDTGATGGGETRPKNVALLYCEHR